MAAVPLRALGVVRGLLGLGARLLLEPRVGRVALRGWRDRLASAAAAGARSARPASLRSRRARARSSPAAAARCALAVRGDDRVLAAAHSRASLRQRRR